MFYARRSSSSVLGQLGSCVKWSEVWYRILGQVCNWVWKFHLLVWDRVRISRSAPHTPIQTFGEFTPPSLPLPPLPLPQEETLGWKEYLAALQEDGKDLNLVHKIFILVTNSRKISKIATILSRNIIFTHWIAYQLLLNRYQKANFVEVSSILIPSLDISHPSL